MLRRLPITGSQWPHRDRTRGSKPVHPMQPKRRFIFHGNAAAYGGRIYRPTDTIIEAKGASSLPVTGGRSTARLSSVRFGEFMRVGRASTLAEGFFDDLQQAIAVTNHKIPEEALTTSSLVSAELENLVVGVKPRMTIDRLRATMRGRSPVGSREPALVPDHTVIKGVSVDGHKLIVDVHTELFRRYDTRSKLIAAADDPKFVRANGASLFMTGAQGDRTAGKPRLFESGGIIHATIVKSLRWSGKPYPGATIDGNSLRVPDLGLIFFGELLITRMARRLTLARFEFGSPIGGFASAIDVDANGGWSP